MKFLLSALLIAALSFIAGLFLPWWSIALIAFLIGAFIPQRTFSAFLGGFLGIFLVWAVLATWIDIRNEHILSTRIAQVFSLGDSYILLIILTGFTGGLVGGFAAMAGTSLRRMPARRTRPV